MGLQSSFYLTDGSTRTYPSTKHIATKQHVAVWRERIVDSVFEVVPVGEYQLVNNSVVFDIAPIQSLYSQIEVRVADTADELGNNPSDIATVASDTVAINTVATNIASVNTDATNIAAINAVSASIANVNTTAGSIVNVNNVGSNISDVIAVAGDLANIDAVATTVVPNIAEILLADDNATIATTQAGIATTKAAEAAASAASINPSTLATKEPISGAVYIGSYTTANRPTLGVNDRVIGYNLTIASFEGWNGTVWSSVGGGATGGGTDNVFIENEYTITANYTIPAGRSAVSIGNANGDIIINSGVDITFGDNNSRWVVL